jgi:hypothetical protein
MYSCDIVMEPGSFHVDGEGINSKKQKKKKKKKFIDYF